MREPRLHLALALAVLVLCTVVSQAPAWAQADDSWSFVFTPQVWVSHIALNGFASAPNPTTVGGFVITDPQDNILQAPFPSTSSPNETVNPQWGLQLAAQKNRWTFAAGFQYVTFETRNTLRYSPSNGESLTIPICPVDPFAPCYAPTIQPGQTWAQEFVDMTRMDIDLSASYFFPDIVKDRVDASLGAGFKFIYASASRQYGNLNPVAANAAALNGALVGTAGLYTI